MRNISTVALLVLSHLSLGCGPSRSGGASTISDSAGVQIVVNTSPRWQDDMAWQISEAPVIDIGTVEGDLQYQLYRVYSAVRLSDGRVVIGDDGSSELRFFDGEGRYLLSVGREGEGPGEFRFLLRVWSGENDSIFVWDGLLNRLSVFSQSGAFVRSVRFSVESGRGRPNVVGRFDDGSMLTVGSSGILSPDVPGIVLSGAVSLSRYHANGTFADAIAELPGGNRWVFAAGGRTTFPYVPFAAQPSWVVGRNRAYLGAGRAFEIDVRDGTGKLTRIVRVAGQERRVTDAARTQFRESLLASVPNANERRRQERFLSEVPFPEMLPAYRSLLVDSEGFLWVEEYRLPNASHTTWHIFNPTGEWLGSLHPPNGLRVLQVGRDYVLGWYRDELDVQHVAVYALDRIG